MNQKQIAERWKKLNINKCVFDFACGGDQMNDTSMNLTDKDNNNIEDDIITSFFDVQVYNKCEFYVNSDGHYEGESGTVTITLNEDEDDEDNLFSYNKESESEWREQCTNVIEVPLTQEAIDFIKSKVSNINGGEANVTVNYHKDFIMSDQQEELLDEIKSILNKAADAYVPDVGDDEIDQGYVFSTAIDDNTNDFIIEDNQIKIAVVNWYTTFKTEGY